MAVAIDTSAGQITHTATTLAPVSLTVAAGTNRALVLLIGNDNTLTVSSVAYTVGSGGAWAKLNSFVNGVNEMEIWSSVAPSTGAVTVQATMSGTINPGAGFDAGLVLYSLQNVDQTTPIDGYASGAVATLSTTLSSGGMILGHIGNPSNPSPIITGTEDYSDVFNEFWRAAHNSVSGTITYTAASNMMDICNVRQAASAGNIAWVKA